MLWNMVSGHSTWSFPSLCRREKSQVSFKIFLLWSIIRTGTVCCSTVVLLLVLKYSRVPGEVRMPSGKTGHPNITDNKDGTVTVKYAPIEKGLHEMDIKYDGNHIPGMWLDFVAWPITILTQDLWASCCLWLMLFLPGVSRLVFLLCWEWLCEVGSR